MDKMQKDTRLKKKNFRFVIISKKLNTGDQY